ncbi:GGDEF domain-containing protein [Aquipuribacter sp. SD81]|uniref:GGDEF domain-containing protein n=1 Tax=Aquipuribacter sp. SD81 TaxID=3127703 RepID=UPI00301865CB
MHAPATTTARAAALSLSVIGLASGVLTFASTLVPSAPGLDLVAVRWVALATLLVAAAVAALPWRRVPVRWTLLLVPVGMLLIGVHNYLAAADAYRYGAFFLLLFVWVGLWHPRGTATALSPLAAVAYVVPLVAGSAPGHAPWTVTYALPLYVVTGEVIAWRSARLHEALRRLDDLARTDPLTGLANRTVLDAAGRGGPGGGALLYLDVDRFKQVNDSYGHQRGDAVLRAVAAALRAAVREGDVPVRIAGDEFAVLLRGPLTAAEADAVAGRIGAGLGRLDVDGLTVTTSMGVAWCAGDGVERLLARADRAMYAAKDAGGARLVISAPRAAPGPG